MADKTYIARSGATISEKQWRELIERLDYAVIREFKNDAGLRASVRWTGSAPDLYELHIPGSLQDTDTLDLFLEVANPKRGRGRVFEDAKAAVAAYEDFLVQRDAAEYVTTEDGKSYCLEIGNLLAKDSPQGVCDLSSAELLDAEDDSVCASAQLYGSW